MKKIFEDEIKSLKKRIEFKEKEIKTYDIREDREIYEITKEEILSLKRKVTIYSPKTKVR